MISRVQVSERNSPKEYCSWQEVELLTRILANKIMSSRKKYDSILSITNGGIIPARLMARELDISYIQFIQIRNKKLFKEEMPLLNEENRYLVIDEIFDTGNTFSQVYDAVKTFNCDFAFLISRYEEINSDRIIHVGKILNHNKWIVFPWE